MPISPFHPVPTFALSGISASSHGLTLPCGASLTCGTHQAKGRPEPSGTHKDTEPGGSWLLFTGPPAAVPHTRPARPGLSPCPANQAGRLQCYLQTASCLKHISCPPGAWWTECGNAHSSRSRARCRRGLSNASPQTPQSGLFLSFLFFSFFSCL